MPAVERAIADAHRREWVFVLAATARDGVPRKPGAWLTTTAKRKALDVLRRDQVFRAKMPLLAEPDEVDMDESDDAVIPDDRLRLIFTCCHPALAREAPGWR
ncbi:hypothetical protein [Acrocarpospora sp. B8E8]|uniref:hypothetical protein n=1 Tax=Acrocarpospora sp. B8E8 TaxID=3153572 RepID=UPI00325D5603